MQTEIKNFSSRITKFEQEGKNNQGVQATADTSKLYIRMDELEKSMISRITEIEKMKSATTVEV